MPPRTPSLLHSAWISGRVPVAASVPPDSVPLCHNLPNPPQERAPMFKDVYHIGYQTDDADAAIELYRRAFGGEVKQEARNPDGSRLVFMRIGGTEVELIQPGDLAQLGGKTGLILHHIGYTVDDLDAELAKLEAK